MFVIAAASLATASGCNTVEGAGEDIESVGEEIEEEADERH
jgi:predicted small secreted protein